MVTEKLTVAPKIWVKIPSCLGAVLTGEPAIHSPSNKEGLTYTRNSVSMVLDTRQIYFRESAVVKVSYMVHIGDASF